MCFLNYKDGTEFSWHDLLVEANGMVFDLLVFGILLSIYEKLREKRDKIERLHEEIDDYRGWEEKEAKYRILGAMKRLNKEGIYYTDLHSCFLAESQFSETNFKGANLANVNFSQAGFVKVNFEGANLQGANFYQAYLLEVNLAEANLKAANLINSYLVNANLKGADLAESYINPRVKIMGAYLRGTDLSGANLIDVNLKGVSVDHNWLDKLEEWQVLGREEIKEKYLIDENGVLREKQ